MPGLLYIGFSSVDRPGINTTLTNIALIKADLRNALMVPIRSVAGYPRYGSILPLLPFELDSPTGGIVSVLQSNVNQQIARDPRITLASMDVTRPDTHSVQLQLQLYFIEYNMIDSLTLNFSTETR